MAITVPDYTKIRLANAFDCQVDNADCVSIVSIGDAAYYDADGDVAKADADAGETESRGRGIVVATVTGDEDSIAGDKVSVCVGGPVEGFLGMTPGAPVYVQKTTPGGLTHTKPTGGAYQQALGYALSATKLMVQSAPGDPASV